MAKEPENLDLANKRRLERLRKAEEKTEKREVETRKVSTAHARFTLEMLLKGVNMRDRVDIPELGEDFYLVVRALTDSEYSEVQRLALTGLKISETRKLEGLDDSNITDIVDRERNAKYFAVALGLSCDSETWTVEDVAKLPVGVPDRIYKKISELSGFLPA